MSEGIVVIGASGGIGAALVTHWLAAGVGPVIAISRQPAPAGLSSPGRHWLCCDYSDEQMTEVVARIAELAPRPHRVVICNGILHQGEIQPEKRLEAINLDAMTRLYQTNALLPLRWISQLLPLFGREPCTWPFSALVSAALATTERAAGMAIVHPRPPSTCCSGVPPSSWPGGPQASNCWPSIPAPWIPNSPARFTPMYRRETCRVPSW